VNTGPKWLEVQIKAQHFNVRDQMLLNLAPNSFRSGHLLVLGILPVMSGEKTSAMLRGVIEARDAFRDIMDETPLSRNAYLSDRYGANIYLKREDLTPVRSYKIRGAFNFFRKAIRDSDTPELSFVCASAGNHAQGFAFACSHFKKTGVIFMPVTTPQQKIMKTESFGGAFIQVKLIGDTFDECYAAAHEHAEAHQAKMVPPFDHADIIEGQATVGLEILNDQTLGPIDLMIVPVGGGGLSAGLVQVFKELSPDTEFIFVEPEGAPSLKASLKAGERANLATINSFVDGAAVGKIGALNFSHLKVQSPDAVLLANEDSLCETIIEMLNVEGTVLEPAGALAIEALRHLPSERIAGKTIVCVTSGGNFDFERLPEVKERALKSAGLKKFFILRLPQRPGALRDFLDILGPHDDITRFEYLKKSARNFGSVLIGIESSSADEFQALLLRMDDLGFTYQDITHDENIANFIL
jgi:threonine dehydratase